MSTEIASDPITTEVQGRIRQAFLLGLARQPIAIPPSLVPLLGHLGPEREPALARLALAGQRQRFVMPPLPPIDPIGEASRRLHEDPRTILPPPARRTVARLQSNVEKAHAASVMGIAVRRIAVAGCRLHPFDLPGLARNLRADVSQLGLADRAYLTLTASADDADGASGVFFDRITEPSRTHLVLISDLYEGALSEPMIPD